MVKPYVVIVDAFSSGALVAQQWQASHTVIHIQSSANLPDAFAASAGHQYFAYHYQYDNDWPALTDWLSDYLIAHVVCGSEFGVELTDKLAEHFDLAGNCPTASAAKRDKYIMAAALESNGVAVAKNFQADSVASAVSEYLHSGLAKVVVKPLDSAGSEDVYICHDAEGVRQAALAILDKTNLMQSQNQRVLVQHFLAGDEYIINSVSAAGHHYITDIWKSDKTLAKNGRIIYQYEELLASSSAQSVVIDRYINQVLDALQIVWGPAHSELILTEDGPILLETGARVSGLANPAALNLATGNNQVALSVDAYAQADKVRALSEYKYQRQKYCYCVNLIAPFAGSLDRQAVIKQFERLAAFESIRFRISDDQVQETVDLNTSPGVVFLLHHNRAQVEADYQRIRQLELEIYWPGLLV